MDIIMLHFADPDKMADYNNDSIPEVIVQHEKAADYYSVSSINLAKEVNNRIINGEFTWRDDFKNLHPSTFGQRIYFRTINHFFDVSWKEPAESVMEPHKLPERTLDPFSYINGHFLPKLMHQKVRDGLSQKTGNQVKGSRQGRDLSMWMYLRLHNPVQFLH